MKMTEEVKMPQVRGLKGDGTGALMDREAGQSVGEETGHGSSVFNWHVVSIPSCPMLRVT